MSELLRSPRGKLGLGIAAGLLFVAVAWLLLVSPQRSKAAELGTQLEVSQAQLAERRAALANPSVNVTVKPSDLYRLTKALPNGTDMSGILLEVNRLAVKDGLAFNSIKPSGAVPGTGFTLQPLSIVVQGRFGDVSKFLGDVRKLVTVRGGRLDARGRLYSVSQVVVSAPDSPAKFPVVKAALTLNAYSYSPTAPPSSSPSTSIDASSSGTVAAGATP